MIASNGKFVTKGLCIPLDSAGNDVDAGGTTNWILVPSWTSRGIFGGSLYTGAQNGKDNSRGGTRKRRRGHQALNDGATSDCGSCRTILEQIVCDEIRQCDVCARAILWTPSHERRYFQAHDQSPDDASPPQKSNAECLPRFIERHIYCPSPLPCSFCTTNASVERWCGSLYCCRDCQIRGEEGLRTNTVKDDATPTTAKVTSVSSSYLSLPNLPPLKLFFCRNRFFGSNVTEEHVHLVDEIIHSISAIERRFKSLCGCDDADIDRTVRIIGAEECALLLTTIIACICPDWIRDLLVFTAEGNPNNSSSDDINSGEESLVEELWAMSRSHSSVSEILQKCNALNPVSSPGTGNTFPSYKEFLSCYLDTKRHSVLRVNLPAHPIVSYATKTIISSCLSEMERGLALDLLMSSSLFSLTLGSDIGNGTNNNNGPGVNSQDIDQSSILQWRHAAHLAHMLSSPIDTEGAQSTQIQTHLQKPYFAFSPHVFRRKSHSCVPTLALAVADLSQKEVSDYQQSPLESLAWLALHDIPSRDVFTISKLESLEGDINTRMGELKRLMGQSYVCSCARCQIEAREYNLGSNCNEIQLKHIADLAMQHGRFDDASTLYDSILRTHPHDGDVLHARAASYLGRASSSSFANQGHCQGYFTKAQCLWEQAWLICSIHPGISTQVKKQKVYRTLLDCEALISKETSINDNFAFTSYLDGRCFITVDAPVLSLEECQNAINTAENFVDGWTTSRHYAVPTTDIPLHEINELHSWFYQLWNERIRPL